MVGALPGKPYWKRVGTDSPRWLRQSEARLRLACPPSPGAAARRTRGVLVEGATPVFSALVRHRAGGGGAPEWSHHLPSPLGVAPSTVIPAGMLSSRPGSRLEEQQTTDGPRTERGKAGGCLAEDLDPGCPAHPGFYCRPTSSLALTLACPRARLSWKTRCGQPTPSHLPQEYGHPPGRCRCASEATARLPDPVVIARGR